MRIVNVVHDCQDQHHRRLGSVPKVYLCISRREPVSSRISHSDGCGTVCRCLHQTRFDCPCFILRVASDILHSLLQIFKGKPSAHAQQRHAPPSARVPTYSPVLKPRSPAANGIASDEVLLPANPASRDTDRHDQHRLHAPVLASSARTRPADDIRRIWSDDSEAAAPSDAPVTVSPAKRGTRDHVTEPVATRHGPVLANGRAAAAAHFARSRLMTRLPEPQLPSGSPQRRRSAAARSSRDADDHDELSSQDSEDDGRQTARSPQRRSAGKQSRDLKSRRSARPVHSPSRDRPHTMKADAPPAGSSELGAGAHTSALHRTVVDYQLNALQARGAAVIAERERGMVLYCDGSIMLSAFVRTARTTVNAFAACHVCIMPCFHTVMR